MPSVNHPDNAVFQAIGQIIARGRTSRLYKSLVKEKKIAVSVSAGPAWSKYPGLFAFYAVPAKGHTNQECEEAIYAEIEKMKTEPVSPEELAKAKAQARANLIRLLSSNDGLASELAYYEVITGDWRNMFEELDKIEKVTAEDIQRVAGEYFTRKNRSVGMIETIQAEN
jgi:predicted Zn-dependent peptidase